MNTYKDDDFIYVNPKTREVKGHVEWTKLGSAKPLPMDEEQPETQKEPEDGKKIRRCQRKRHHPWGTYRTMKKLYRLEGREKETEEHKSLEEALQKALKEPFWD